MGAGSTPASERTRRGGQCPVHWRRCGKGRPACDGLCHYRLNYEAAFFQGLLDWMGITGCQAEIIHAIGCFLSRHAHIDDIARKLDQEPGRLLGILLQLELKGLVRQSSGNFFSLEADQD